MEYRGSSRRWRNPAPRSLNRGEKSRQIAVDSSRSNAKGITAMDGERVSPMQIEASSGRLTRRGLLQRASCILAMGVLRRGGWMVAQSVSPGMATLGHYIAQAGTRALPGQLAENTKQHVLGTLAA